jgi:glutamate synthase (NADPH) small chain
VICLYRRDQANMPGSRREVANAEEEGVHFEWLAAPLAFDGQDRVERLKVAPVHLGPPDASGRQKPSLVEGDSYHLDADMVIKALGFDPEDLPDAFGEKNLKTTPWGTLRVSYPDLMTSLDGVFAAGDIVRGASLVVWAIRDGRDAAAGILRYLAAKSTTGNKTKARTAEVSQLAAP